MNKILKMTFLLLLIFPITATAMHHENMKSEGYMKKMDVVDMAAHTGKFNTLIAAIQAAELEGVLRSDGPFTVLAPTDAAFERLPEGTLDDLLKPENKDKLVAVLQYHVLPGSVYAKDVASMNSGKTASGKEVSFKVDGKSVFADNAKIVKTDIQASNGVIHIIDQVLFPM